MKKLNTFILPKNIVEPLSFHSFKVVSKLFKYCNAMFKRANKTPSFLVDQERSAG